MILLDPTLTFLGIAGILLAVSTTLSLSLRRHPSAARVLVLTLAVSLAAFGGAMILMPSAPTHRGLLSVLPAVLLVTALIMASAYHEELSEKHALDYRNAVFVCAGASLLSVLIIAMETVA